MIRKFIENPAYNTLLAVVAIALVSLFSIPAAEYLIGAVYPPR